MKKAKLNIVLVNFNSASDTIECLESIMKSTYSDYQVFVVDNSEGAESQRELKLWSVGKIDKVETSFNNLVYPLSAKPADCCFVSEDDLVHREFSQKVIFIKANRNNGFAAANNIALRHLAQQDPQNFFVWVLNNDTVIEKSAMEMILSKIETAGLPLQNTLFGTPLMDYSEPGNIQAIGGIYNSVTGVTTHISENVSVEHCGYDFQNPPKTDYPIGASMLVHQEFLNEVGLMAEDYFLFFEELDWASRTRQKGGNVKIIEFFGIYHKQGKSTKSKNRGQQSEFVELTFLRSRLLFAKKWNRTNLRKVYLSIFTLTFGKKVMQGKFQIIPKMLKLIFNT
jgi:GT2 family glycosyltransferase